MLKDPGATVGFVVGFVGEPDVTNVYAFPLPHPMCKCNFSNVRPGTDVAVRVKEESPGALS
jgi:hypothetical protein